MGLHKGFRPCCVILIDTNDNHHSYFKYLYVLKVTVIVAEILHDAFVQVRPKVRIFQE